MRWKIWVAIAVVAAGGAVAAVVAKKGKSDKRSPAGEQSRQQPAQELSGLPQKIREPAVAGAFYPRDKDALATTVDRFLAAVKQPRLDNVRGLVCPHAGYAFSGLTAAHAYKQLAGRDIDTVIIMGPSHTTYFRGASIPNVDAYRTPLGAVKLSPKAKKLAKASPFVSNPQCHLGEHCLEVQLPFLQTVLSDFTIIPIVFGKVDEIEVARAVMSLLDDRTVVVASSDLSHYYPYDVAQRLDQSCTKAICQLDVAGMKREEACGKYPILALMHIARQKGWKTKLLDLRNSGDTAGDRSRVVGYAAIAFFETPGAKSSDQ